MDTQSPTNNIKASWFSQELRQIKDKKQSSAYFFMFLTFLTVAFFGFFVLRPALSTISTLQKQLKDNKLVFEGLQDKLATIQALDGQYQTIQTQVPLINAAIPTTPSIPFFTRQIETLAKNNNISIQSFVVLPVELYPLEEGKFSFALNARGEQKNLNNFIENISNFDRIITIEKIATGETGEGEGDLSMSGMAYFGGKIN